MKKYKSAIIGILVAASVAVAFIQIDDTHTQTILSGIKTFIPEIHFQATGGGSEYVGLVAPAVVNTPSVTYKLPPNDGTSGQALVTDGSANLSFATVTGAGPSGPSGATGDTGPSGPTGGGGNCPGGADTNIQFNDLNACNGSANLTYDYTNSRLAGTSLNTSADGNLVGVRFQENMSGSPTGTARGLVQTFTSASNSSQVVRGMTAGVAGDYSGSKEAVGLYVSNNSLSVADSPFPNLTNGSNWGCDQSGSDACGNVGIYSEAFPAPPTPVAGAQIGVYGDSAWSLNIDMGGYFKAAAPDSAQHIGLLGAASTSSQGTHFKNVAGYFTLADGLVRNHNVNAALVADSGDRGLLADIFRGYDADILVFEIASNPSAGVSDGFKFQAGLGTGTSVPGVAVQSTIGGDTNVDLSFQPKGGGFVTSTTAVMPVATAVASLPTCDSTRNGARATAVNCDSACTFTGSCTPVVAPTPPVVCPMYCDGSAWKEG